MSRARWVGVALLVLSVVALVLVVLDVRGPIRGGAAVLLVLIAPGLALSLSMGPLSPELRLLVAIAASVALATVISVLLVATGVWSNSLATALLAGATVLAVGAVRTPPASGSPRTAPTDLTDEPTSGETSGATPTASAVPAETTAPLHDEPDADLPPESARRTR